MTSMARSLRPGLAALALPVAESGVRQVLFPAGEITASNGAALGEGPWRLTPSGASTAIAQAQSRGNALVVDYEHQTIWARENGQPAPAAGRVQPTDLRWDDGVGITGEIAWTERAAAMVKAGEYSYLSPVFSHDEAGNVTRLYHWALTNAPAIDRFPQLAAAAALQFHEDRKMDELLKLLGLEPGAEETAAVEKLTELLAAATAGHRLLEALQLKPGASPDEAVAALTAIRTATPAPQAPDATKWAPMEVVFGLQQQVAALTQAQETDARGKLIQEAIADGRLIGEAMQKWAREQPLAALRTYLDVAQPIPALSGSQTRGRAPDGVLPPGSDPVSAAKAEWASKAALRDEFGGDEAAYLAFMEADSRGLVRVFNTREQ